MRAILLAAGLLLGVTTTGGAAQAACPDDAAVAAYAERLLAGRQGPGFGTGLSLADGQCAQDKLVALLERHWGRAVGYKVGLVTPAVQARFGVDHPLRGTIFARTLEARSGAELPAAFGAAGAVESDLLVRVRDEGINDAGADHLAILRHLDQVIPFIELPDGAIAGQVDGPNLLAANVNARLGVVGDPIPVPATEEFAARLGSMTVVFSDNRRELAREPGRALLGHPLNVIPWLVRDLQAQGRRLRAGDVISLGGFAPSVRAEAGQTYTLRYEGLLAEPVTISVRMR